VAAGRKLSRLTCAAANGGIASLLQSARLVAAVAELGSLVASPVKPRAFIMLWLIVVGLFTAYGFFGPGHEGQLYGEPFDYGVAMEATLVYSGIGFTLATCLAVSLYAITRVRAKLVTGFKAILLVLLCSAFAAFIPPFVMACSGHYHGESTLAIAYVAAFTIGIGLVGFVLFDIAVLVLYVRRHDA